MPSSAEIAALIAEAPVPRPTLLRTFNAMMAREFRVLRRNAVGTFTRAVMQPLLFVFVFAYVFPKIGGGFKLGGGAAAAGTSVTGSINFATILVPGLMASMLLMQGIMAVTFPLVMEFSWQRTIEDRALAPSRSGCWPSRRSRPGRSSRSSARASCSRSCCWCTRRGRLRTCT